VCVGGILLSLSMKKGLLFFFEVPVVSRFLLNVTDLISSTHVVRLLVGLLVGLLEVQVHFGQFSMISKADLMQLGHRIS
jgi:hypothetical protein